MVGGDVEKTSSKPCAGASLQSNCSGQDLKQEIQQLQASTAEESFEVHLNGQSPLFRALLDKNAVSCRQLIEQGACVNQPGLIEGYLRIPPLCQAVRQDSPELVTLLMEAGANREQCDNFTSSPLSYAIRAGNRELCQLLLQSGCQVNKASADALQTPLHLACSRARLDIVKTLLNAGADPNLADSHSRQTPGFFTSSLPIVQELVSHGLDVNFPTRSGETLLHHAIVNANMELVQYLVQVGSELNSSQVKYRFSACNILHTCYRQAPIALALEEMHFAIARLLIQHGCRTDFIAQPSSNDMLLRIINSGEWDLIMSLVYAEGNHTWTQLVKYSSLSSFMGRDQLGRIWDWLDGISHQPFTLKAFCRLHVRRILQRSCHDKSIFEPVNKLPIPKLLQGYCTLRFF